jgi:hypothetical protein
MPTAVEVPGLRRMLSANASDAPGMIFVGGLAALVLLPQAPLMH